MRKKVWDSSVLKGLIEASGLGYDGIADLCDIKCATFASYAGGYLSPSLDKLWRMADLFDVTIDELVCRDKSSNPAQKVKRDYSDLVTAMGAKVSSGVVRPKKYASNAKCNWPYNFLESIFGEWNDVLSEKQEEGLKMALDSLSDKERMIIEGWYKDKKTLKEIGIDIGVSRERVRQIILGIIRRLKHPAYMAAIREGVKNAEKEAEIAQREMSLDEHAKKVAAQETVLRRRQEVLEAQYKNWYSTTGYDIDIAVLGLTARSFNALRRGYYADGGLHAVESVQELVDCVSSGKLRRVKNIGVKSIKEICEKLKTYAGVDYSGLYDV